MEELGHRVNTPMSKGLAELSFPVGDADNVVNALVTYAADETICGKRSDCNRKS